MFKTLPQFKRSIRFNLFAAFAVVAAISILSALYSWTSATQAEKQMDEVVTEIIPLVLNSHTLSKDVGQMAVDLMELTNASSNEELQAFSQNLHQRSEKIENDIKILFSFNFEVQHVANLQKIVKQLSTNLDKQMQLTREIIASQTELQTKMNQLADDQQFFLEMSQPLIDQGYQEFIRQGQTISKEVGSIVSALAKGLKTADPNVLEYNVQLSFDTLINTTAAEMRANLEMVALTFLISGILHEAAIVDTFAKIDALQFQLDETKPLITKLMAVLSRSSPDNNKIYISSAPIIAAGMGEESILALRKSELALRETNLSTSEEAFRLSAKLAENVAFLAGASKQISDETVENLRSALHRYRLFSIIAAFVIIVVSVGICLLYVERRVISRISSLRQSMEQQAEGSTAAIADDIYGDEISAMTKTLERFVLQRDEAAHQLTRTLSFLNEAQHLARIGNCLRNQTTLNWDWSHGFYHMLGYLPDELPPSETNFWKIVLPEDCLQVELFLNTLSSSSRTSEIEFRMLTKDKEVLTVRGLWKLMIDAEYSPYTQHGIIQDITERKRIEEDFLKSKKMESIAILAGGIAHDFNNLLTGILGNIALVSRLTEDNEAVQEHLRLSEKAALRARDLTGKLQIFSSGGNPVKSITQLPHVLLETVEFSLSGSNVKCNYSLEENLWPIDMDSSHIHQIIQNLVVNADQSMAHGGTITIFCSNRFLADETIAGLPSGPYVHITISDSGEGISPDHLEKIFDPYYTTKGFYTNKGSGLGLAIVHAIITKHGGAILVDSKLGSGTEFSLYLPAMPETPASAEAVKKKTIKKGSGNILVMDDEEIIREVLGQMLIELGYSVYTAEHGREAIELYDTLHKKGVMVDALILDLTIPGGVGGKEAIQELLRKYPTARAIVSSGYAKDPVIENFRLHGFSDFIIKPYQLEELAEVVSRVAGKRE